MADKDHGPRIGADPEIFVQNQEGKVIPICGKIGGTKDSPLIIDHLIDANWGPERNRRPILRDAPVVEKQGHYAVQEDNVMLEFNVPAYGEGSDFTTAISKILTVLENNVLSQHGLSPKYEVMQTFKPEDIAPFPQAFTVGCMPDMDAYAEEGHMERVPFNATHFGNHRFCGGHLHVQYNHGNVPRPVFAQFMDLMTELPFLRWDKQKMRRMFYGQPGIYREKPYGIEYRTLSNFWLGRQFREKWLASLIDNVYNLANLANTHPEKLKSFYSRIDWGDVQHAIKSEDVKLADEIIHHARYVVGVRMSGSAAR